MKIGLLLQGGKEWAGGMEYTRSIALAFARLSPAQRRAAQLEILCGENVPPELVEELRPIATKVHAEASRAVRKKKPVPVAAEEPGRWEKIFGKSAAPRAPADEPEFDFLYPFGRDPKNANARRCAAWMWDFQHKYLPQLFTPADVEARDQKFDKLAKNATTIVFSSHACLADFRKFYPESRARTEVLHFRALAPAAGAADEIARVRARYHLPEKFFLVCSQFWQHKNHRLILAALSRAQQKEITVVCTGLFHDHRNPFYSSELLNEIRTSGGAAQIVLLGLTPRADQLQLLRGALAILQPSRFEGWSTVVEESRAFGKFMLLSDIAVHREQNPPDAAYFGCDDADHLAALLDQTWTTRAPGPDFSAEEKGRQRNAEEVLAFAQRFLEIASKE